MFAKKENMPIVSSKANENMIETIIGAGVVFDGKITGSATLRIDGKLMGDTEVSGLVIVGETGEIKGNVTADRLLIAGQLVGQVKATERVEIVSGGRLIGDVQTASFVVADGSVFNGNCQMGDQTVPAVPHNSQPSGSFILEEEQDFETDEI